MRWTLVMVVWGACGTEAGDPGRPGDDDTDTVTTPDDTDTTTPGVTSATGPCRLAVVEDDLDADGTIDIVFTYAYDDLGRLVSVESEEDLDDQVSDRRTYTWDDRGNKLTSDLDYGKNGTVELHNAWTYDTADRMTSETTVDRTTLFDVNDQHEWGYDVDGRLITETYTSTVDGDPSTSWDAVYEYDGDLLTTMRVTGWYRYTATYTYDDAQNLVQVDLDDASDGDTDEITTHEYDDQGDRVHTQHFDHGFLELDEVWVFDDAHHVILDDLYLYATNGDTEHQHWELAYDAAGRMVYESWDDDAYGVPWIETWEYDDAGREVRNEFDYGALGRNVSVTTRTYDERGLEVLMDFVSGEDRYRDLRRISTWDCGPL